MVCFPHKLIFDANHDLSGANRAAMASILLLVYQTKKGTQVSAVSWHREVLYGFNSYWVHFITFNKVKESLTSSPVPSFFDIFKPIKMKNLFCNRIAGCEKVRAEGSSRILFRFYLTLFVEQKYVAMSMVQGGNGYPFLAPQYLVSRSHWDYYRSHAQVCCK